MESYHFHTNPVAKPRMTQRDKWKKRPVVDKYYAYKDAMNAEALQMGLPGIPGRIESLIFHVQMPKSWSKKKKEAMNGKPHRQTPDLDNLLKAFQDALCTEDKHVYAIAAGLGKFWSHEGFTILTI